MSNKDNVIDFNKFQQQKAKNNAKSQEWVAVINDRYAFRLRPDGMLEIIEAETVIEVRKPSYPELQLIAAYTFMESTIVDLVSRHEPHRVNDDYLTYPYTDWPASCKEVGENAVAWHEGFKDDPLVPMQRAAHVLMQAVRERVAEKEYPGMVGLMPQQVGNNYKDLTSDRSNYFFRLDDIDAIEGTHFKASLHRKVGRENKADIKKAEIDIAAFKSEQDRVDYLAVVLTCLSDSMIREFTEHAVARCGGSFYTVE